MAKRQVNVLLIGGSSNMMDAMIDRLKKDKHRVYLLTGRRDKSSSYRHVFERYDFPYDDESVKDIFESIKPDLVLFTGAYDTNFNWHKARQESVRYTASLMNILSVHAMVGRGRFIYLSSQESYSNSYVDNIPESEPVSPSGFKAMAVAQGEEMCGNYRKLQGIDAVVLRIDRMYGIPRKGVADDNLCFRMCLEALKTGKISANGRNVFSMIYQSDAVELIYKIANSTASLQLCYQISSMEETDELQLAGLVAKAMGTGVQIVDNSVGEKHRVVLDGSRYSAQFGQKILNHYEKGVGQVAGYMKRYKESFLHSEDAGGGTGARIWRGVKRTIGTLFPFIENVILFIPFFILNNTASGSEYFNRLDFLLLYVLLFAIVHGQQQAIFSSLLAIAGYCFRQMYGRSGFEVLLDYNTYVWMAQLFIVGMTVGYMRDQLHLIKKQNEEEIQYLSEKVDDIADINDSNVRMKHSFESQLVNQRDSLGKIYEITSSLDYYGPEEVLFYAAQVLGDLMDSKDVAVYSVANDDYARLFSATSPDARRLGNSIKYTDMEEVYKELKAQHVYINKTLDERYPLMAGAVYTEDRMELILMIWGIPWQRMTLGEANRLTIVGALIRSAVVRANHYMEALMDRRYVEGTNMLNQEAFSLLVKAFFGARAKGLTECVLLEIMTEDQELAATALSRNIRQTDYIGRLEDGGLYVLLSNTDDKSVGGVAERFRSAGYESRLREEETE